MSKRLHEEDVTRKAQLKDIANFMKSVLPEKPHHINPINLNRVIESLLQIPLLPFKISGGRL